MPRIDDINFTKSVILIEEHNDDGAIGLIINKPLNIELKDVLSHLDIQVTDHYAATQAVYMGGPVGQDQGFVLHTPWPDDSHTEEKISISASKEILKLIASGKGPDEFIVTLGYSGWEAGQLEEEVANNEWLVVPCSPDILFSTPSDQRWSAAAALLGFDINQLSGHSGHA